MALQTVGAGIYIDNCVNKIIRVLPLLKLGLKLLLGFLALLWVFHGFISHNCLEVKVILDDEPGSKHVIVVDIFDERLDG